MESLVCHISENFILIVLLQWRALKWVDSITRMMVIHVIKSRDFQRKFLFYVNNKQIFHAFLFNVRNYSPEVSNIRRREAELNIILPRVNNSILSKYRHGIFVLLYTPSTKQNLG